MKQLTANITILFENNAEIKETNRSTLHSILPCFSTTFLFPITRSTTYRVKTSDKSHYPTVLNHLKSDKEVADLWNGMSKSVKLTKVPKMDKVVADVNKMYGETWRVKSSKYLRTYVFASWQLLTLLAALFMLFLTTVQAFCSVYVCARVFHQLPEIPGSEGAT
ncbi:hypothetical protein Hanom_Chr12g01178311 [Helianthus anomalus]